MKDKQLAVALKHLQLKDLELQNANRDLLRRGELHMRGLLGEGSPSSVR